MKKIVLALAVLFLILPASLSADAIMTGLDAYARSDWQAAQNSFRAAVSDPATATAEAWYWLVMSEISSGDLTGALRDADRFLSSFPSDSRAADILYQKGRLLYQTEYYERSIQALYKFVTDWPRHPLVSSAYYWMGECLFAVGRYEEAAGLFNRVITGYPLSPKYEASVYRITLIGRTGREEELLRLLKMSHEESLRIIEDYQRREKTYEQAITAYQKRISDMIRESRLGELEQQLGEEKVKSASLLDRVSELEMRNAELVAALALAGESIPEADGTLVDPDSEQARLRLEELRRKATSIQSLYDQILEEDQ